MSFLRPLKYSHFYRPSFNSSGSFSSSSSSTGTEYAISGHSPSQSPTDKEKIAVDALTGQLFGKSHELINGETAASGSESNYGNSSEEDEDSTMVFN